jgi:hypothetical protein
LFKIHLTPPGLAVVDEHPGRSLDAEKIISMLVIPAPGIGYTPSAGTLRIAFISICSYIKSLKKPVKPQKKPVDGAAIQFQSGFCM